MYSEVSRERTFFLITRQGFDFFEGQRSKLIHDTDLRQMPLLTWHHASRPALYTWLSNTQSASDKERLAAVGNLVMPDVARLAINLLATK